MNKNMLKNVSFWTLLTLLITSFALTMSGCSGGGGGGGGSAAASAKTLTISGSFNPNLAAAAKSSRSKARIAAVTSIGTVSVIDAATGLAAGTPADILANYQFSGLTIKVPTNTNKLVALLVADITGVGKFRFLLPIDMSNLSANSLRLVKPISLAISPSSESITTAVETALGVTGKLGNTGVMLPAGADFNAVVNAVTTAGGVILTSSDDAISLTGSVDPAVYPAMTVTAVATPAEQTGFGTPVSIKAVVANAPAGVPVVYAFSTDPTGTLNTFTASNLGLPATIQKNGDTGTFTTKTAKESIEYLTTGATLEDGETPVLTLRDKLGLIGVNNLQLSMISYVVHVTATAGAVSAKTDVLITPTNKQNSVKNVSVGTIVLLNTKSVVDPTTPPSTPYTPTWNMTLKPGGSSATLNESSNNYPWFIADLPGKYTINDGASSIDIYAGKYIGIGTWSGSNDTDFANMATVAATGSSRCENCHNSGTLNKVPANIFPDMANSGHARIFSRNVIANGPPAGHYGTGCLECHTVGYIPGVSGNDGFADKVALLNYTLLKTNDVTNWTALNPTLKGLANAQCENCHGPNGEGSAHANALAGGIGLANRVTYDAEMCADCHGEPGRHNRYQLWQQSVHGAGKDGESAYQLTFAEGTSASCARCHTAQGFKMWMDQINNNTITQANILKYYSSSFIRNTTTNKPVTSYVVSSDPTKDTTGNPNNVLAVLNVTKQNLAPVTCAACHPPHYSGLGTAKVNTRAYDQVKGTGLNGLPAGYVGALPAGFTFGYAGTGSVCMFCHNSRNGLHEDAVRNASGVMVAGGSAGSFGRLSSAVTAYSAPHAAGQSDVFAGRNAYFMNGKQIISGHSNVKNACVGCHMETVAATNGYGGANHTMKVSNAICASCHGNTDGKGFQSYVVSRLGDLNAFSLVYLNQVLVGQKVNADLKSGATILIAKNSTIKRVNSVSFGRSPSLNITATDPVSALDITAAGAGIGNSSSSVIRVNINPGKAGEYIAKINWNQQLIAATSTRADANGNIIGGSRGIHNPEFVRTVLENTIAAIVNAPPGI